MEEMFKDRNDEYYNMIKLPIYTIHECQWVSDWCLFNNKPLIVQLCHSENTVPLKEMNTMMSFLYLINTLSSASSSKSPQVDTFLHWDTESTSLCAYSVLLCA